MNNDYESNLLNHEILDKNTEIALTFLAQQGNKQAAETMIRSNQRMVYHWVRKYIKNSRTQSDIEDLAQWGNIGLLIALRKFSPEYNTRFASYAAWWVQSYIRRYSTIENSSLTISKGVKTRMSKLWAAKNRFYQEHGFEASHEQLAGITGFKVEDIALYLDFMRPDLEFDMKTEDGHILADVIPSDDPAPQSLFDDRCDYEDVYRAFSVLDDQEKKVIRLRFGFGGCEPISQRKIGEQMGLSTARIQHIEKKATGKIRKFLQNLINSD